MERKITIKLTDGDDVEIHFNPFANCVTMNGTKYGSISEEDRDWLVDIAGIDMEYHFYGVEENNDDGCETTSPPEADLYFSYDNLFSMIVGTIEDSAERWG